jgi:hypothetical protein
MIKTKWKMFYLVISIIRFIIILIPLFQNAALSSVVSFYGNNSKIFTSAYMPIVFMAMIEWVLITLYVQSLFSDFNRKDATKFDLSK